MTTETMKLAAIATRIKAHLSRMEADRARNLNLVPATKRHPEQRLSHFYGPNCWSAGSRLRIMYIAYQGAGTMTRAEGLAYLAWLDAGNYGKHHEALRALPAPQETEP